MDHETFDALTRLAVTEAGTRRTLLRVLTGSALLGIAAHLGLTEGTAAKAKHHKRTAKPPQPAHQGAGKSHARPPSSGGVQSEGKRKGKGHHKPPSGVCDNGHPRCRDGSCARPGECCPGSKRCSDGWCVKEAQCCDDEKICDDGSCASQDVCCPGERMCDGGGCVKPGDCCVGEKRCLDGTCVPTDTCCVIDGPPVCAPCHEGACVGGRWTCQSTCQTSDAICCGGECLSPCSNGCDVTNDCQHCTKPPQGTIYCAAKDICVATSCPPGKQFNAATCSCELNCGDGVTCSDVPAMQFKNNDGTWMPAGCCAQDHIFSQDGYTLCAEPRGGGSAFACR